MAYENDPLYRTSMNEVIADFGRRFTGGTQDLSRRGLAGGSVDAQRRHDHQYSLSKALLGADAQARATLRGREDADADVLAQLSRMVQAENPFTVQGQNAQIQGNYGNLDALLRLFGVQQQTDAIQTQGMTAQANSLANLLGIAGQLGYLRNLSIGMGA